MAQFFVVHPETPQLRLIKQAVEIIHAGGIVVYPTDSCYALGCSLGHKEALDRLRAVRQLNENHLLTLVCKDLSELGTYAQINNHQFRILKNHTPGCYTFILEGTRELPRRLLQPKRHTIGVRIPDNIIAQTLLHELGAPILSTSLTLPQQSEPLYDPYEIREVLEHQVDVIIDGGYCQFGHTTVVDLTLDEPKLIRQGLGSVERLGLDAV